MATPKPKARFVDFAEMLSVDMQQDTALLLCRAVSWKWISA